MSGMTRRCRYFSLQITVAAIDVGPWPWTWVFKVKIFGFGHEAQVLAKNLQIYSWIRPRRPASTRPRTCVFWKLSNDIVNVINPYFFLFHPFTLLTFLEAGI